MNSLETGRLQNLFMSAKSNTAYSTPANWTEPIQKSGSMHFFENLEKDEKKYMPIKPYFCNVKLFYTNWISGHNFNLQYVINSKQLSVYSINLPINGLKSQHKLEYWHNRHNRHNRFRAEKLPKPWKFAQIPFIKLLPKTSSKKRGSQYM